MGEPPSLTLTGEVPVCRSPAHSSSATFGAEFLEGKLIALPSGFSENLRATLQAVLIVQIDFIFFM